MEYVPDKDAYNERVKKHEYEITVNKELKFKKVSEAEYEIDFYLIVVNGNKLSRFDCVIGECETCKDKYEPVGLESLCDDTISYCLYVGNHCFIWHDYLSLEQVFGTRSWRCTECDIMKKEEKYATRKKLANTYTKKYREKYAESMIYLIKKGGLYEDTLKRILCHKFHHKFLGNDIDLKMFHNCFASNHGTTLLTNSEPVNLTR